MALTLRMLRASKKATMAEVASVIGVHPQTYSKLEEYPGDMTIKQAKLLADYYNTSVNDIFFANQFELKSNMK